MAITDTILTLVLLLFPHVNGDLITHPVVETKVGMIRGLHAPDGEYSMFLGIPYAKVEEANPFGPSTPYPKFENTFEALNDSAICPQIIDSTSIEGALDCLNLNVYVPDSASSENRLPVLVWIYGGAFSVGFASSKDYGPKFLVRHDIILVTLNYRLGPYGFMCLGTPEVPGNQGLKDQLLALRWVNANIESFGGDVNQITLSGQSAGGISVDYHFLSAQETLFSKVILLSGSTEIPGYLREPDLSSPFDLASKLGFQTEVLSEALSFLATVDPILMIRTASGHQFTPCVENDLENVEKLIIDYPVNLNVPKAKNMPILTGLTNDEWLHMYANQPAEFFDTLNVFQDSLKIAFDFKDTQLKKFGATLKRFYLGDAAISEKTMFEIADFDSDFMFNHAIQRSISKYLENQAANIYFYVFSYIGERNLVRRNTNVTAGGALHGDELSYLFEMEGAPAKITFEDQVIIDRMTTMWANFVKFGNPTPETSALLPVKWEPITSEELNYYLEINSELALKARPFNKRMAFFDLLYDFYKSQRKGYRYSNADLV